VAITIPINIGVNKKLIKATNSYNQSIEQDARLGQKLELYVKGVSEGISLLIFW